jgi:hypothetical protein
MKDLGGLHHDNLVQILSYLRAVDLAAVRLAHNSIFSSARVNEAIEILGRDVYNLPTWSPVKKSLSITEGENKKPQYLYNKELQCLSTALCAQPPVDSKGMKCSATAVFTSI